MPRNTRNPSRNLSATASCTGDLVPLDPETDLQDITCGIRASGPRMICRMGWFPLAVRHYMLCVSARKCGAHLHLRKSCDPHVRSLWSFGLVRVSVLSALVSDVSPCYVWRSTATRKGADIRDTFQVARLITGSPSSPSSLLDVFLLSKTVDQSIYIIID